MKISNDSALEDAIFLWFTQRHILGKLISGPLLCEKVLKIMNTKLDGSKDFNDSTCWLKNVKYDMA